MASPEAGCVALIDVMFSGRRCYFYGKAEGIETQQVLDGYRSSVENGGRNFWEVCMCVHNC